MPEESEPHEHTFMQWPVSAIVHPERDFLQYLQQTIADIANSIAEFEPVIMLIDRIHFTKARRYLSEKVILWDVPTEDLWCRDSGPLFVKNTTHELAVSLLNFNGWGNKQVHQYDGLIAGHVAEILDLPIINHGLVGEPGGVESNGAGLLIVHESSWVHDHRNPSLSRDAVSELLLNIYGAAKILWSPGLKDQDITDYHIDSLVRFAGSNTLLFQTPLHDPDDPFAMAAEETLQILRQSTNLHDEALNIITIPTPEKTHVNSIDFVASYANYYICNSAIICAEFGDEETDTIAYDTLAELYGREVIMLNVDALGEVGGGIHCATCQQPKSLIPRTK